MSQTDQSGIGEDLAARRCEQILDCASRIFARRGYRQTDVQVIADELGIGKGTIYRYFPAKEALFLAAVDRAMQQLQQRMNAAAERETDPLERIRTGVRTYLRFFDENPIVVELLIQERAEFRDRQKPTYFVYREASRERWMNLLKQAMADGFVRPMPPERVMQVVGNLLYGSVFTSCYEQPGRSYESQANDILDVVLNGILNRD